MAITTQDQLISAIAAGISCKLYKEAMTCGTAGFYTHFRNAGMPGSAGGSPTTTGTALSRTSTGAIPIPAPSNTSYITSFETVTTGISNQSTTLILADRLIEYGGLSATVITAQTVSALALPARATGATDVELWLEVYAAGGTTASPSVTASYTNQAGTAGRTATITGGTGSSGVPVNRSQLFSLQAGDTGVQSVQSLTLGTSTGTAGNIGLVLRRKLLLGPLIANNTGFFRGWAETDLHICPDNACLELLSMTGSTSIGINFGSIGIAQG